jgi:hypothetical protein
LRLPVRLTKAQISTSPEISFDRPVSKQMEKAQDSEWDGGGYFSAFLAPPYAKEPSLDGADPNLRSMAAVEGYHVGATDGSIGHIENFILDTAGWDVRYLIVDTKDWWFGQHVLISPFAVQEINWVEQTVRLDVSRESVKNSPPWKPFDVIDKSYQERLHGYYMWPAYGF